MDMSQCRVHPHRRATGSESESRADPASTGPIPVTIARRAITASDPFAAYCLLREAYGSADCFLLESLAGHAGDRGAAVVGFGRLMKLSVSEGRISLTGDENLVKTVTEAMLASEGVAQDERGLSLVDREGFWRIQRALRDGFDVSGATDDGYSFGVFALYGYDAAHYVEQLPSTIPAEDPFPDLIMTLHAGSLVFDLRRRTAAVVAAISSHWDDVDLAEVESLVLRKPSTAVRAAAEPIPRPSAIDDSATLEGFSSAVNRARDHIAAGDIYQVQLGHRIDVTSDIDVLLVYRRLRERNPSPYMCLADFGAFHLISASPEMFVRIAGSSLTMRPIAGTAHRAGNPDVDAERVARLLDDDKERAEHVMLVDLCRNDLGRVAVPGTVAVEALMTVERYSHVFHLVSTTVAEKLSDCDAFDVIRAAFPAGTMTGAPKIRAMEIIEDLETVRRGGYAGAFGLLDFGGYTNTALCIRTIFGQGNRFMLQASSGIVADSTAGREWTETLAKLNALFWAVTDEELL